MKAKKVFFFTGKVDKYQVIMGSFCGRKKPGIINGYIFFRRRIRKRRTVGYLTKHTHSGQFAEHGKTESLPQLCNKNQIITKKSTGKVSDVKETLQWISHLF